MTFQKPGGQNVPLCLRVMGSVMWDAYRLTFCRKGNSSTPFAAVRSLRLQEQASHYLASHNAVRVTLSEMTHLP